MLGTKSQLGNESISTCYVNRTLDVSDVFVAAIPKLRLKVLGNKPICCYCLLPPDDNIPQYNEFFQGDETEFYESFGQNRTHAFWDSAKCTCHARHSKERNPMSCNIMLRRGFAKAYRMYRYKIYHNLLRILVIKPLIDKRIHIKGLSCKY